VGIDEIPPADRPAEGIRRDRTRRTRHERLGAGGEQLEGLVVVEAGRQVGRLPATGQRRGQARGLGADALVERLVIAEAGQPGQAQANGGELAQRAPQQAGMMRVAEFGPEEIRSAGTRAVRPPEDLTGPVERLHTLIVRPAGVRRHHPAFEQGEERLQLVPLRVVDRVPGGHGQLQGQARRRTVHRAEGADGGVDGVHRERLLGALHGQDLGVPGVGETGVEKLEPCGRLDVGQLQVGDVDQAQQRTAGTLLIRPDRPGHGEFVADEVRLARADLDGPVGG
jgi:hypothetical protein